MSEPIRFYVETTRGRLAYRREGRGRPVVLIHGALTTADDMALALMESLAPRYDVLAFDRPGHGGSDQTPDNEGSVYEQAAMLGDGWSALGCDRPIVIGHSFGGAVALSAAMANPDRVGGVVAVAPICFPEGRLEQMLFGPRAVPVVGEMLTLGSSVSDLATLPLLRNMMFFPQIMPDCMANEFPFGWASTSARMLANGKDSLGVLRSLTRSVSAYGTCPVPVQIMGGTHDVVVNNAVHGHAASRLLPNASFCWIAGSGHMAHHFRQDLIGWAIEKMSIARHSWQPDC